MFIFQGNIETNKKTIRIIVIQTIISLKRYSIVKKIITLSIILISIGGVSESAFAQDPQFTQFYANPLYLNPAFAGTARCPRVNMNYRNQWPGITGTFITYSASYDQHVDPLAGGLGLLVTNDQAGKGTLNTTNVSGMYSYQLSVTRSFSLKAGLQATYLQKKVDWAKLTFGDMIDPRRGFIYGTDETPITEGISTVDFSAGILGFSKTYFFGAAVHHLTEPDESLVSGDGVESPLPRKYTGHAGAVIPLGSKKEEMNISPNILYQQQQNFKQLNFGVYINRGPIIGGLWYRNQDAVMLLVGLQQEMFKFGYSYDVTVSKLSMQTLGSHEISFSLQFDCRPKKRKFRTISCPSF